MRRFIPLTIIIALVTPTTVLADAVECRERVNRELGRELRLYRSVLFGKRRAEDAPIGDVRYDNKGRAWIKEEGGTPWKNSDPEQQGLEWSNTVMDQQDEHKDSLPLIGLFETKRMTTSELIPYLLQSIRAFECRALTLCNVVRASENVKDSSEPVDLAPLQRMGCVEFSGIQSFPECHLVGKANNEQVDTRSYCDKMVAQTLRREQELLKLVVEYDAGFRSLLQFAGNFDIFLKEMRWPLANTVRQAVELIGKLERIPCFISSCDSSPAAQNE